MALVAGSYERFLFGYSISQAQEGGPPAALARRFTHAAHKGVVKCLAAAGQYLASGGADDCIHLYDLKADKDLGFLMSPGEGAVTALEFFVPAGAYNPTHLLSGAADGSISVWSVGGGWECMKTMRGHRKEVNAMSVHPSGALALSCSRDGTLRMWDLVKGRATFSTKLEAEAEGVAFSPSGQLYALLAGSRITLHAIGGEQGLVGELPHPRRALCMAFSPDGAYLASGAEDGSLRVWETQSSQEMLCVLRAHATRIRGLALPAGPEPQSPAAAAAGLPPLIATASTDGVIKLWSVAAAEGGRGSGGASATTSARCLAEAATKARLTSLCVVDSPEAMGQRLQEARAQQAAAAAAAAGGGAAAATGSKGGKAAAGGRKKLAAQQQQQRQQGGGTGATKRKQQHARQQEPALQQPRQERPGKKAKLAGGAAAGEGPAAAARPSGKPGAADGRPGKAAGGKAAAGAAGAAAEQAPAQGGVVDFMDAKDWQRAKQKRKKQKKAAAGGGGGGDGSGGLRAPGSGRKSMLKARRQAAAGKPGQQRPKGGGGGGGKQRK